MNALFLHRAFALQSPVGVIFLKITASAGKLRNGSSAFIAKYGEAWAEMGTETAIVKLVIFVELCLGTHAEEHEITEMYTRFHTYYPAG